MAVAESVTSGNIQAVFSLGTNATQFFQGGITVYNLGQKSRHLHVEPTDAVQSNCVSKKVADQMAIKVCEMFSSDYGIGITGYASPVPEQKVKRIFAYISIARKGRIVLWKKVPAPAMEALAAQLYFTEKSIRMLITALHG